MSRVLVSTSGLEFGPEFFVLSFGSGCLFRVLVQSFGPDFSPRVSTHSFWSTVVVQRFGVQSLQYFFKVLVQSVCPEF